MERCDNFRTARRSTHILVATLATLTKQLVFTRKLFQRVTWLQLTGQPDYFPCFKHSFFFVRTVVGLFVLRANWCVTRGGTRASGGTSVWRVGAPSCAASTCATTLRGTTRRIRASRDLARTKVWHRYHMAIIITNAFPWVEKANESFLCQDNHLHLWQSDTELKFRRNFSPTVLSLAFIQIDGISEHFIWTKLLN